MKNCIILEQGYLEQWLFAGAALQELGSLLDRRNQHPRDGNSVPNRSSGSPENFRKQEVPLEILFFQGLLLVSSCSLSSSFPL